MTMRKKGSQYLVAVWIALGSVNAYSESACPPPSQTAATARLRQIIMDGRHQLSEYVARNEMYEARSELWAMSHALDRLGPSTDFQDPVVDQLCSESPELMHACAALQAGSQAIEELCREFEYLGSRAFRLAFVHELVGRL